MMLGSAGPSARCVRFGENINRSALREVIAESEIWNCCSIVMLTSALGARKSTFCSTSVMHSAGVATWSVVHSCDPALALATSSSSHNLLESGGAIDVY